MCKFRHAKSPFLVVPSPLRLLTVPCSFGYCHLFSRRAEVLPPYPKKGLVTDLVHKRRFHSTLPPCLDIPRRSLTLLSNVGMHHSPKRFVQVFASRVKTNRQTHKKQSKFPPVEKMKIQFLLTTNTCQWHAALHNTQYTQTGLPYNPRKAIVI